MVSKMSECVKQWGELCVFFAICDAFSLEHRVKYLLMDSKVVIKTDNSNYN